MAKRNVAAATIGVYILGHHSLDPSLIDEPFSQWVQESVDKLGPRNRLQARCLYKDNIALRNRTPGLIVTSQL